MTVLVTGCAGFIGSHLAEALLKKGSNVIGVDNFDPYYSVELKKLNIKALKQSSRFRFIEGDIGDDRVLDKAFNGVDTVYHLAASAGVRNSLQYPVKYCNNDVLNTVKVLEWSRKNGVKKLVFASSSSVYGEVPESELPIREDKALKPITPYSLSKQQAETWCRMYSDIYGLSTVIIRYFTPYGPRQRPDEAFTKFIARILGGQPIEVYGDGRQTRDFTYIGDVVHGTILAGERGSGVYNVGAGNRISVNEMVSVISRVAGIEPKVKNIGKQQGDVSHTHADISRAKNDLGYDPRTSLEDGARKHVEWVRNLLDDGFVFS